MTAHQPQIADLINAKRAAGYDAAFEALMRQPWYCPHCKSSKTILQTMIAFRAERDVACSDCGNDGITFVHGDGVQQFRKLLDFLEPFNRSGTA